MEQLQNKKVVKSKIKFGLPFMVPDLLGKFQMICFLKVIESRNKMQNIRMKMGTT
jgi:hypothetical protein